MTQPPYRNMHNRPAVATASEEAVIFDQRGQPRVLTMGEVMEAAWAGLKDRPHHLSLAMPFWNQLQQMVLVIDMARRNPTAAELADMAKLLMRIADYRKVVQP